MERQFIPNDCPMLTAMNSHIATFPPTGAGQFGAGSQGAVLLRSVMAHVSTADSTLMVGGV